MSTGKDVSKEQTDVSRRKFLKYGAGVVVVGAAAAAGYYALTAQPPGPPTETTTAETTVPETTVLVPEEVEWGIWSWGVELVQDNARIFNEANPDVHVKVGDYGLDTYGSGLAAAYAGGKPPDMHYSTPDITITYHNAKQTYDMETDYPEIRKYLDDVFPGYRSGLINPFTGKVYGLFYYSGGQTFVYNKKHLDAAGISGPPATMEQLREDAKTIKKKGVVEFPLGFFAGSWGFVECACYGTMLALTNQDPPFMWDEDLKPTFNYKGSPFFNAIKYVGEAIWVDRTSTTAVVQYDEPTTVKVMGAGTHSYIEMPDYELAFINPPGASAEAGNLKYAVAPGSGRISSIYRTYVASHTANDYGARHRDAVWRLMQFTGGKTTNTKPDFASGKYQVVKRLAMQAGLAFPYASMWQDQEILDSMKAWCDPEVRGQALSKAYDFFNDPKMTPWWDPWWGYWLAGVVRPRIHSIWLGEHGQPASDDYILQTLNEIADEWTKMKQAAGG